MELALVELLGARPPGDLGCTFGLAEPIVSEGHVREQREAERLRDLQLIRAAEERRSAWRRSAAGRLERGVLDGGTGLPDLDRVSVYDEAEGG